MPKVPTGKNAQNSIEVKDEFVKREHQECTLSRKSSKKVQLVKEEKPGVILNGAFDCKDEPLKKEEHIRDQITVVFKQEDDAPEEIRHISQIQDGPDANTEFDLTQLGLGENLKLDEKFRKGFSREVISKTFGGGYVSGVQNWQGPTKIAAGKEPYLAFNTKKNPSLSTTPGQHGMVLSASERRYRTEFNDGTPVSQVSVFVSRKPNDWVYVGIYNVKRSGMVAKESIKSLPHWCVDAWVEALSKKSSGKARLAAENQRLAEEAAARGDDVAEVIPSTKEGIRSALRNGQLSLSFNVLQCVDYCQEWFEKLSETEEKLKQAPAKTEQEAESDLDGLPPKKKRRTRVKKEELKEDTKEKGLKTEDTQGRRKKAAMRRTRRARVQKSEPVKENVVVSMDDDLEEGVEEAYDLSCCSIKEKSK